MKLKIGANREKMLSYGFAKNQARKRSFEVSMMKFPPGQTMFTIICRTLKTNNCCFCFKNKLFLDKKETHSVCFFIGYFYVVYRFPTNDRKKKKLKKNLVHIPMAGTV